MSFYGWQSYCSLQDLNGPCFQFQTINKETAQKETALKKEYQLYLYININLIEFEFSGFFPSIKP